MHAFHLFFTHNIYDSNLMTALDPKAHRVVIELANRKKNEYKNYFRKETNISSLLNFSLRIIYTNKISQFFMAPTYYRLLFFFFCYIKILQIFPHLQTGEVCHYLTIWFIFFFIYFSFSLSHTQVCFLYQIAFIF